MKRFVTLCLLGMLCIFGNAQTSGTTHIPLLETDLEKENFLIRGGEKQTKIHWLTSLCHICLYERKRFPDKLDVNSL